VQLVNHEGGSRRRYRRQTQPPGVLAENHVTGIRRTNGTQTKKKFIGSAEPSRKGQARRRGLLRIQRNKIVLIDRNGIFLEVSVEN
jgi:hypothetical protein